MEDQYGMADLRQYMNGRQLFASIQPPELLPATTHQHRNLIGPGHHQYEMVMGLAQVPAHGLPPHHQQHHEFLPDSSTTATAATTSSAGFSGLEMEAAGGGGDGSGRWPRQETLTLLEIRSRLDSKFKEANQKGPLWDEVSRIMSEEHGYQRTGKKCREKFENLYKYYKKTKEGRAGRQDGKHYRFFRQLEALYGETSNINATSVSETHHVGSHFPYNPINNNNNNHDPQNFHQLAPKLSDSLSLSNSSDFNTTSSDGSDLNENSKDQKGKKGRGKRSLKAKIKDFIDGQMRKLMEKQEAWFEKMMKMIENKEKERILREEEWRNQEKIRIEREHKFWANERAWIEARDATLMDALHKLTSKESKSATTNPSSDQETEFRGLNENQNDNVKDEHWPESEITRLIQLRTSMESRFQQMGFTGDEVLWEEIAAKMSCLGYDKSSLMCKNKWDSINSYLMKCNKKRKENSTSSCYNVQINNEQQGRSYCEARHVSNDQNAISDGSCFRYLMGEADQNLWENYELKLSKGGDN
ncbi:trihelix transcription factor PTL-like [Nicotiana tabacum]|uniref:Trihelix transcription factor PTL-like n=1 Tax=Nicotiana tabacum TaxID=4097 RepID=A0A1S4D476_TOBAC|nr:PREDICTED: trihelix transcription factor PTL-like [Nicotiana tabacum]